jgi:uncharacterized protein (UPF0332 family)
VREETRALIRYRMERAEETLEEAALMLEKGHANTAVNRLYYACFYAVNALLLTRELSSARHSGVRTLFHQYFIKSSEVSPSLGMFYDLLFDNRQKGDYADFVRFRVDDVQPWLDQARHFVATLNRLVETQVGK